MRPPSRLRTALASLLALVACGTAPRGGPAGPPPTLAGCDVFPADHVWNVRVDHLPVHIVVNRMRSSLGWSRSEVLGMVDGFVSTASVHVLPDDRAAADRALVAGRPVTADRGSALAQGIAGLLDAVHPASVVSDGARRTAGPREWLRQRRAGTGRPR